jgi:hypothetical protein
MQRNAASFMRFDASYREHQRPALRVELQCAAAPSAAAPLAKSIYYIKGILQNACVVHAETPVLFFALITAFNSVVFESF